MAPGLFGRGGLASRLLGDSYYAIPRYAGAKGRILETNK